MYVLFRQHFQYVQKPRVAIRFRRDRIVEALNVDLAFQRGETEDVQILIRKESDLDDAKGGVRM